MTFADVLDRGLEAFTQRRWGEAFDALTEADGAGGLDAEALARLGTSAILVGRKDGIDIATRAHEAFLAARDDAGAARTAMWIGMHLMDAGESARSSGWFARASRIVETSPDAQAVSGLVLIPQALVMLETGDPAAARDTLERAIVLGEQYHDPDTIALGRLGLGQLRIMLGEVDAGVALFDEVMVAVTAGEISPVPSGIAYCETIGVCTLAFDFGRAREWTLAFDRWCGDQPDMVAFSGQCQAQRAALYRLHGAWPEALAAARTALERARRGDRDGFYGGWYEQAEIQRLRGDVDAAEDSYRHASEAGYAPQPGLALLRLGRGRARSAQELLREAVAGAGADLATRRSLLPALIEIELAMHDLAAARRAADELTAATSETRQPMLRAAAAAAEGAVLLEEGSAREALDALRRAWALWHELDIPYEAARCRVLVARACRALGDEASASMEFDSARATFAELGAPPDVARVDALAHAGGKEAAYWPLTAREVEVVRLVAAGKTNRVIAHELYLSEKTVDRHLSNVFAKLGITSRTAATAYAYEHALV
jgi:DNA-binding NarL/FixJ family response regulator